MVCTAMVMTGCPLLPFDDPGCRVSSCNDGNICTDDSCDLDTGDCIFAPIATGTDCSVDNNVCNGIETCNAEGICSAGKALSVDDNDACTSDSCDPLTGDVSHEPIAGCAPVTWQALATRDAPSARTLHTAVWTGSEMIIWGGKIDDQPPVTDTGARYVPAADTWLPVSMIDAPPPRHSHNAVWTGTHMLVWGGFGTNDYEISGALYDPQNDSWTAIDNGGAPQGRTLHASAWTGTEMIIWGGIRSGTTLGDGARYRPGTDSWTTMSSNGAPSVRFGLMSAWTGRQLVLWGGGDTFDWLDNGAYYDPSADSWSDVETDDAPFLRESGTGIWTGDHMIIWGGWDGGNYLGDGALLDPTSSAGTWPAMARDNAPAKRAKHASLWLGNELLIWGGCAGMGCNAFLADGGRYNPEAGGTWTPVPANATLRGRVEHTAVWTGDEVIVFGGRNDDGILGGGARVGVEDLSR